MEGRLISILFCVVLKMANVVGQNPTLKASSTSVFEQQAVELICEHSATTVVSWWLRTELVTVAAENNGVCAYSTSTIPSIFSVCTCGNSRHSCTLKPMSLSNNGEVWTCSITDPATSALLRSNEQTLEVKAQTTTESITTTEETDLSTDRKVALAFGIIGIILGVFGAIVVICVLIFVWTEEGFLTPRKIFISIPIIVWDVFMLWSGASLIDNQHSDKGLDDGLVIASLVVAVVCVVVVIAFAAFIKIKKECLQTPNIVQGRHIKASAPSQTHSDASSMSRVNVELELQRCPVAAWESQPADNSDRSDFDDINEEKRKGSMLTRFHASLTHSLQFLRPESDMLNSKRTPINLFHQAHPKHKSLARESNLPPSLRLPVI